MLNFICTKETLEALADLDFIEENDHLVELSVDLIELPFWFVFVSDEKNWTMTSYKRNPLTDYDIDTAQLFGWGSDFVVSKETFEGEGAVAGKELAADAESYFFGIRKLGSFVIENHLEEEFEPFDIHSSGILLSVEDEKITYKLVTGKERPDIMCARLCDNDIDQEYVMTRPFAWTLFEKNET